MRRRKHLSFPHFAGTTNLSFVSSGKKKKSRRLKSGDLGGQFCELKVRIDQTSDERGKILMRG
jgi:hypothetical protein